MSEWRPGDVAMVVCADGAERIAMHTRTLRGGAWRFSDGLLRGEEISVARPLVVIDRDDVEQVERLAKAYRDALPAGLSGTTAELMRTALREFAAPTPPRPAEPTGLGAVVEDAKGARWVRSERARLPWLTEVNGSFLSLRWHEFEAVRVLSEGVTP